MRSASGLPEVERFRSDSHRLAAAVFSVDFLRKPTMWIGCGFITNNLRRPLIFSNT